MSKFEDIETKIRRFCVDRNWDQFHSPKNLCIALNVEAAELLELFQWLTEEQSQNLDEQTTVKVGDEIADVFIYLARLSDKLEIDLLSAVENKIIKNALKYPVEKSKGKATKYDQLK